MAKEDTYTLNEIDPEDIGDVLVQLEKSFNLSLPRDSFRTVKTFGDICDVYTTKITGRQVNDCTSQQAFYKVRDAIACVRGFDKKMVGPGTRLEDVFPRGSRLSDVSKFKQALGIRVDFLTITGGLCGVLCTGILLSLGAFFFNWRVALTGLSFFMVASWVAGKKGKELDLSTVGGLASRLETEHYFSVRRQRGTVNKNEVIKIIRQAFANRLGIDEEKLGKDAVLGW